MAFDDLSAYFRWVDDGVVRLDERVKDVLPARDFGGVIEHLVLGVKSNEGAMADVAIQSIRAWGLKKSPAEMTYVNGPRAEVARKLTELRTDLDLEPLSPTDSERST